MNYIDQIATEIAGQCGDPDPNDEDLRLYRIYAVLCLTVGTATSNEHVHDAWSAWRAAAKPDHKSLIPFGALFPEVQRMDTPYRDAIRRVAAWRTLESSAPGGAREREGAGGP